MSPRYQLSAADEAWLRSMGEGERAEPVVAMEKYVAVVDSRDDAVTRVHRMMGHRRRLWARYKGLRRELIVMRWVCVGIVGAWILWKF